VLFLCLHACLHIISLSALSSLPSSNSQLHPELELVAQGYEKVRYANETDSAQHDIFFIGLDASRNFEFFQGMGFQTIPHVFHVKPTKSKKQRSWQRLFSEEIQLGGNFEADNMVRVLGGRTGMRVPIERPPEQVDFTFIILVLVIGVSSIWFFATVGRPIFDNYVRSKWLYLIASLIMYGYCVAGGMYNRLRNTPWAGRGQNGEELYFHRGANSQYQAETFIVASCYITAALAVILVNKLMFRLKTFSWRTVALIVACSTLVHFVWRYLRGIYTMNKNGGYNFGIVW
jgi:OST3 / OST6 family, transporter family